MADDSVHLMLGRLEGKMDMILANQQTDTARIDKVEARMGVVESAVASSNSTGAAHKAWLTYLISGSALIVSVATFLKSLFIGPLVIGK